MYGAIIGDIAGSTFEHRNVKTKDFPLFPEGSRFTDDTVMTVAVAAALMRHKRDGVDLASALVEEMQGFGRKYAGAGYGGRFIQWLFSENPQPYNSFGNGSAMRVSPCGLIAATLEEALELAKASAEVTHNHPEGIKGVQAVASAVFLAKHGSRKQEIRDYIIEHFYPLNFTLDEIRPTYKFDVTCQGSVPQAIQAFLESSSFEDAIRNAISIGGDSDTIGAITGSIAWTYYGRDGIQPDMQAMKEQIRLPEDLLAVVDAFEAHCPPAIQNDWNEEWYRWEGVGDYQYYVEVDYHENAPIVSRFGLSKSEFIRLFGRCAYLISTTRKRIALLPFPSLVYGGMYDDFPIKREHSPLTINYDEYDLEPFAWPEEAATMDHTGYRIHQTGVFGYEFYREGERVLQISSLVLPSPPACISGYGYQLISKFDYDSTIIQGLTRYVLDEKTDSEAFRIVYQEFGRYDVIVDGSVLHVDATPGNFVFRSGEQTVARIKYHPNKDRGIVMAGSELALYYDVRMDEDLSDMARIAILSFPMLQFAL